MAQKYHDGYVFPSGLIMTKWVPSGKGKATFMCFCGDEFTYFLGQVVSGYKKSCGCLQGRRASEQPVKRGVTPSAGHDFGYGIRMVEEVSKGRYKVSCRCGRLLVRKRDYLLKGEMKCCGCTGLWPIGYTFLCGLRVLEYICGPGTDLPGKSTARFRCRCGKTVVSKVYNVENGITTSCGCDRKNRVRPEDAKTTHRVNMG